jgi:hypothetical protein
VKVELTEIRGRLGTIANKSCGADAGSETSAGWVLSGRTEDLDSVLVLRLVLAIEQEFGVVIQDDEIQPDNFAHLDALALLIQRKIASLSQQES